MTKLLGIYREIQHSPNRESDDALILDFAAKRLKEKGFEVAIKKPEDVSRADFAGSGRPNLVFMMCEREGILNLIQSQEREDLIVVNPPESIWNTYRYQMIPLLKSAKIPMPKTDLYKTGGFSLDGQKNIWVKRGDVHNTQAGDVFLAKTTGEIEKAFRGFKSRGIEQAALQEHIPGDLIKFYGVGNSEPESKNIWFNWFYHKGQDLKNYKFSREALKKIICQAASQLKLEIYGGDAIVNAEGDIFLIDINAWPSFALFRDEASQKIADYLTAKVKNFAKLARV